jgi:hypothetical protein
MQRILLSSVTLLLFLVFTLTSETSCKKEKIVETVTKTDTVFKCTQNIQGLWVGTYTVGAGQPVPAGTQFYFAFSIYPGGTISYKSKGFYNGSSDYITFADGTWTLNGTSFSFNVKTINSSGGDPQLTQVGTATFNISNGTLTNGTIADSQAPNNTASWSMTRVN